MRYGFYVFANHLKLILLFRCSFKIVYFIILPEDKNSKIALKSNKKIATLRKCTSHITSFIILNLIQISISSLSDLNCFLKGLSTIESNPRLGTFSSENLTMKTEEADIRGSVLFLTSHIYKTQFLLKICLCTYNRNKISSNTRVLTVGQKIYEIFETIKNYDDDDKELLLTTITHLRMKKCSFSVYQNLRHSASQGCLPPWSAKPVGRSSTMHIPGEPQYSPPPLYDPPPLYSTGSYPLSAPCTPNIQR